ncbi:MAG: FmdB family zinc ribbon protein [Paraburkholderia tropica]|uniref:FmdB family regulatory protein n=1 Tax=Paraburkholderia tropica TaxID=92647 RepID=A0ABX5MGV7_9BURK|nr:FmdB family zinc ribbon protein [Paraburkholderia tropica]MDE1143457.1 zinc ribbon domain-containing protein [Paraburkholderia tropica]PXX10535.1 putative FmdB family regulatory protein [Paraburkholderia tropica]PZW75291.1 putative FmdB family regulatory protein [Paraburkholderia tropica]
MPIYAYRCESCGFAKDVLQKISDAPLTQCPSCGADAYRKQVTAAGFQLKGSGWYVTDFRGGNSNANNGGNSSGTSAAATGAKSGDAASSSEGGKSESASPASPAAAATTSAAPAASGTSGST